MDPVLKDVLALLLDGKDLSASQMQSAVGCIMDGAAGDIGIAALLTALRMKGETVPEIVGAARAMRDRVTRITPRAKGLLDTCGTGGDSLHTFNISTATALVAAAAGVPVAKHGNRSVSSSSGSADVLESLGVNITLNADQVAECIDAVGIGFCFAPLLHGAMKHAGPVRRELGFRTLFNLLGPLTNPAAADYQLLGSHQPETARMLAGALAELGIRHGVVVCGDGRLDEVSLWGKTVAFEVRDQTVEQHVWSAASFGMPVCAVEDLQVSGPDESAKIIREVLEGQRSPAADIVIANAAAALWAAECETSLEAATARVTEVLEKGDAAGLLQRLVDWTGQFRDA